MSRLPTLVAVILCAGAAGCGTSEPETMKPEDTVVGDLVTAPERVQEQTNAAMDAHRQALERQLAEGEDAPAE